MKIDTQFPYDAYDGYLVVNPEGRKNICLVHKLTKRRTTVSFARYLMSVKEKRLLTCYEQVDHKDEDKTNDVIENLQILTISENNKKNRLFRNVQRKMVKYICPGCNKEYEKPYNCTHIQKGGKYTSCSIECSHKVLKEKYTIEKLKEIGKLQIIAIFKLST